MTSPSGSNSPILGKWGYTQVKVVKFSYMWTISNFSFCPEEFGEVLQSPVFAAGMNDELKWRLDMYPKGHGEESKDYLSLFLSLNECKKTEVKAKFRFSIIDRIMKKTNSMEIQRAHTFVRGKSSESHGYPKFFSRDKLMDDKSDLLPDDKLTVCCEVSIVSEIVNVSGIRNNATTYKIPKCRVLDDFGSLLDGEKFSDVTLAVGKTEFRAHKAILATRSRVFAAMFEHEMTEMKKNRVEISGMDEDVFGEMLRFVYTGRTANVDTMADGLLAAADKYDLERLKALSESVLCNKLSIDNAADCLMLADLHCAERLKTQAIEFINGHAKGVMETAGFKSMIFSKPHLIVEALRTLALRENSEIDELFEIQKKTLQLQL